MWACHNIAHILLSCHPEHSEGSEGGCSPILRDAQNDT